MFQKTAQILAYAHSPIGASNDAENGYVRVRRSLTREIHRRCAFVPEKPSAVAPPHDRALFATNRRTAMSAQARNHVGRDRNNWRLQRAKAEMRDRVFPLTAALEHSACQCSTIEEFFGSTAEHEMAI